MRKWITAGAVAAAALAATAVPAQNGKKPQAQPEAFQALVRCRGVAENEARLRCFDAAAASLQQAAEKRELVMVDRNQIRETKRSLFGLDIPDLNPFGGSAGGDDGEEEVKSIESTVASATTDNSGRWTIRLADGSTWTQTDYNAFAVAPKKGHKVKVTKATLGSYMMRVNGQPGVRAKRQL